MFVTRLLCNDVLLCLTSMSAYLDDGEKDRTKLKQQSFASIEALTAAYGALRKALENEYRPIVAKLGLYLENASTEAILIKPVKANLVEAVTKMQALLVDNYTPDEMTAAGVISPDALKTLL